MTANPYQSPTPSPPRVSKGRASRWAGLLLLALSLFCYVPMTIGPFVALAWQEESPFVLVPAGIFNGIVCVTLFLTGRWLFKKGRKIDAEHAQQLHEQV